MKEDIAKDKKNSFNRGINKIHKTKADFNTGIIRPNPRIIKKPLIGISIPIKIGR
ncbi:MAG: hypothetical protein H8E13_20090 [Actinobacteria bacterium]|nr:hypothetical protein [Actinomycetota bacterium]